MLHKNKCTCKKHKFILNVDIPIEPPVVIDTPVVDQPIVDPSIMIADKIRVDGVDTMIIFVANSYTGTNLLEGVKTDQIELL